MGSSHPFFEEVIDQIGIYEPICELIIRHHCESHRHYHTLRHLDLMLRQLPLDHASAREMIVATLFHDIIYDPARSDNEAQSLSTYLSVADEIVPGASLDAPLVSAMILATKSHHFHEGTTASHEAINAVLKADLSILWHPDPSIYEWYAKGVRQEYEFVPEEQFRQVRASILISLRDDLLRSDQLTPTEAQVLVRNAQWELQ